jgi:hypothetical protein
MKLSIAALLIGMQTTALSSIETPDSIGWTSTGFGAARSAAKQAVQNQQSPGTTASNTSLTKDSDSH